MSQWLAVGYGETVVKTSRDASTLTELSPLIPPTP